MLREIQTCCRDERASYFPAQKTSAMGQAFGSKNAYACELLLHFLAIARVGALTV